MTKKPNENDVVFIQALAELLSAQDLTEIEVNRLYGEDNSLNVRISKTQNVVHMAAAPAAPLAAAAPAAAAPATPAEAPAAIEDPAAHPGAVTSPMVGTVFDQNSRDGSGLRCGDLIHSFHRFDDQNRVTF